MKSIRVILTVAALQGTPLTHAVAQEQEPQRAERAHRGFWLSAAFGGGKQGVINTRECDPGLGPCPKREGWAVDLRLGGTFGEQLLWGFEFSKWCVLDDGGCTLSTAENWTAGLVAYPWRHLGLSFRGGVGVAAASSGEVGNEVGFATTLGAEYDIRLGENLYLTPSVTLMYQAYGGDFGGADDWILLTLGVSKY